MPNQKKPADETRGEDTENEDERVVLDTAHNDQSWRQTLKGL